MDFARSDMPILNLLIVDDEQLILDRLKSAFNWNALGFQICDTAPNGLEAVNKIKSKQPDVILTDITMPYMDGISLLQWVKKESIGAKTIVLSGYDNFEFVRSALLAGATDYLLKPLEEAIVCELFKQLYSDILKERSVDTDKKALETLLHISNMDICSRELFDYLNMKSDNSKKAFFVLTHYSYITDESCFVETIFSCRNPLHAKELYNSIFETFEKQKECTIMINQSDNLLSAVIIFNVNANPSYITDLLVTLFKNCDNNQLLTPAMSNIRCLLSEIITEFDKLSQSYQNLLFESEHSFYREFGIHTVSFNTPSYKSLNPSTSPEKISQTIFNHIHTSQDNSISDILDNYFQQFSVKLTQQDRTIMELIEVYVLISLQLKASYSGVNCYSFDEIFVMLSSCSCFNELKQSFIEAIVLLHNQVTSEKNNIPDIIVKVRSYIDIHFPEPISLSSLSQIFYINCAYLSTLFCQKTGVTLSRYIRSARLKHAKSLLMERESIAKIAKLCGYPDYRNFCNTFKSEYNMTPSAYRLKHTSYEEK